MNITKERKKLELIFASTAENVEQANSEIRTFLTMYYNFTYSAKQNVLVISEELLQNAYIHGNKEDPEKNIFYTLDMNGNTALTVTVEDEGTGFDVVKKQNGLPNDPKHVVRQGLILVNALANNVSYQDGGKKIEVTVSVEDTIQKLLERSEKENV